MDEASDLIDELVLLIDEIDTTHAEQVKTNDDTAVEQAKLNEIRVVELQCDADERNLKERITLMIAVVNDAQRTSEEDAKLVQTYVNQVNDCFEILNTSWNQLKSLSITAERLNELFVKQDEVRKHVLDNTASATIYINDIIPETTGGNSNVPASTTTTATSSNRNDDFKMENCKYPVFSGDIRNFARFKADFENFVVPIHSSKQKLDDLTLCAKAKKSLDPNSRKTVNN